EVARAVGLRPKPNLASHGWPQHRVICWKKVSMWRSSPSGSWLTAQRVFDSQQAIDPRFELGAFDGELQLVPCVSIQHERFGAVAELNVAPDTVVKFPKRDVILGFVISDGKPIPVRFDIEENTGAPVGVAGDGLKFHAD